ncbi:MAG: MBL fold metallo-hydrolase [Bacteroides sp.]|nr:MBL fold metallo-hydrolase [Bacteroides sp.]
MIVGIIIAIVVVVTIAVIAFVNQPRFGRLPRGERLERIEKSPHYKDGKFKNLHSTVMMTSQKGRIGALWGFLFKKEKNLRPDEKAVPVVKTDLKKIRRDENVLVWFGHSSYFIQIDGKRVLVDPVFCMASPVSFVNKPFKGTDVYKPDDIPDIDYLIITHDHWDHLDYHTVIQLKNRVDKVVCPLGVGEHFEYWGFEKARLVELDWFEEAGLDEDFLVHCLPTRHFSGRFLKSNQSLWVSFLLETPSQKIYMGGDGGYDTHFAEIGKKYPGINLAILENGQYNEDWKYIHTLPVYLEQVAEDLKADKYLTVHHSKYALARHPWDEPLKNARELREKDTLNILMPVIGEVVRLD